MSWNCDVQIEAYRDMITPVVDAFKYLTQVWIYYFIIFYILTVLSSPRMLSFPCINVIALKKLGFSCMIECVHALNLLMSLSLV